MVSAKQIGVTPSQSNRISSSPKRHGTSGVPSRTLLEILRLSAGVVSRFRVANSQRSTASLILMGLSPMLGATLLRSRMPANQPMRPDTDDVGSQKKAWHYAVKHLLNS